MRLNGNYAPPNFDKRAHPQAVVLLPFIDEKRLLTAIETVEGSLTAEERARNSQRIDSIFLSSSHPLAPEVFQVADAAGGLAPEKLHEAAAQLDPSVRPGSPLQG